MPGFTEAAFDPGINALHCALVRHPAHLAPSIRAQRDALVERAVDEGPTALDAADKAELLADADSARRLHAGLWSAPDWFRPPLARDSDDPNLRK